jgi:putative ABC transport system substrate-binding protein
MIRRREFVAALGGAAAWPLAARGQQGQRVRRIGVLIPQLSDDPDTQADLGAFLQGLQQSGWSIGRNVRIDYRFGTGDLIRRNAAELVALAPDVILAAGISTLRPLLQITRTVPIVFPIASDPVGAGVVNSLAHPGGNATGFMTFEPSIAAKWLELLKEIAPGVRRVAVLRDFSNASEVAQFGVIAAAASPFRVEVSAINMSDAAEIERGVAAFARIANAGLIIASGGVSLIHRPLIAALATRYRLPAVYPHRQYVAGGGLICYGPDVVDQFRRAAGYVDRILEGEKPADLPVQAPTKYELVINLTTAKALGLDIPATVYARADEVIE